MNTSFPVFDPASSLSRPLFEVTRLTFWLGGAVFVLVTALTWYLLRRYRHRGAAGEPPQVFGNAADEWGWIAGAAALVGVLLIATVRGAAAASPDTSGTPDVYVTAHQWFWSFRTPDGAQSTGALHIPAGRRILLDLTSADVIHDFAAPQLARKIDVIPGQHTRLWIEASRPGTYSGACNEFCGAQHAWMRFTVIAEDPAAYEAAAATRAAPAAAVTGRAARGQATFAQVQCSACHLVRGAPSEFTHGLNSGPELTHFAQSRVIAGGILTNTPEHLRRWLRDTQGVKPGAHMPTLPLTDREIDDLTAYLEALK